MEDGLHFLADFAVGGEHVECEEVFLKVEVEVGLHVGEPDGVLELEVLDIGDGVIALDEDVAVEVLDYVVELLVYDLLHVDLDLGLEVVHSVDEAADVPLEGPAGVRLLQPLQQLLEGVALLEFAHVDGALVVDEALHDLEVGDEVGEFGADVDLLAVEVLLEGLVALDVVPDEVLDHAGVNVEEDVGVGVVLHYLEDEDLVVLEGLPVAVDEESKEVQQLGLVVAALRLGVDGVADLLDEFPDVVVVEEQGLVVVVHLPKEVDAAHVLVDVVLDLGQVADEGGLDVLVVPDEADQELVAEVEQFLGEGSVGGDLLAVLYVLEDLEVDVLGVQHTLLDVVAAVALVGEVEEGLFSKEIDEIATLKAEVLLVVVDLDLVLDDLAHHVDDLHDACAGGVEVLLVDGHIVVGLVGLADDLDDGLVLHDVEFFLVLLDLLLEGQPQVLTHEQLLREGLDALLALQQYPLHDRYRPAGQPGVVVPGQLDHLGDDADAHQTHLLVVGELLDEFLGRPVVNALVKDAGLRLQGPYLLSHLEGLEGLAGQPHRQVQVVVQNLLYYVHALQLAVHHQAVLTGGDAGFGIVGLYAVVRDQDV